MILNHCGSPCVYFLLCGLVVSLAASWQIIPEDVESSLKLEIGHTDQKRKKIVNFSFFGFLNFLNGISSRGLQFTFK